MRPTQLAFVTGLSFALGCSVSSSSQSTQSPDQAQEQDGEGDGEGAAQDPGRAPRTATGAKRIGSRKGVKKLSAKKPPRDPGDVSPSVTPVAPGSGPVSIGSFVPTAASPGSVIEVFGDGFSDKAKVTVGGVSWKVVGADKQRLAVEVPAKAKDGKIKVKVGKQSATSEGSFTVLEDDGGFGKPSTDPAHGLLGNVYNIGKSVSELPSFNDLGEPIAVIAVDTLDVPRRDFKQGFPGVGKDVVEWFGIHFKGSLNIVAGQEGEYELCLNSDDGSQLYIDQTPIVDNDGLHPAKEVCELVYMEPGEYQLDILYFQGPRYEIALQFSWAKDGGEKQIVPAEVLFKPLDRG